MNEITISKKSLFLVIGLVAVFALYYLVSNMNATSIPDGSQNTISGAEAQKITLRALPTGYYDQQQITVKKGQPVELTFFAEKGSGCGAVLYMEDFNVKLKNGEKATFTPTKSGQYKYHCSMYMFVGTMNVV